MTILLIFTIILAILSLSVNGFYIHKTTTLSNNRAKSVYDYLIANKIEAARLTFKGYADSKPINDNLTEQNRSKNRRTEFKITP